MAKIRNPALSRNQLFANGDIISSLSHGAADQIVQWCLWDGMVGDYIYRLQDLLSGGINNWPETFIVSWGFRKVSGPLPSSEKCEKTSEPLAALITNTEPTCLCLFPASHDDDCAWKLWRNSKT